MAGDWIKMRTNLWDDPRLSRLCDLTGQGEAAVVGGLYWLWAMADTHTEDGILPGLTTKAIDRKTGVSGFGDALCAIGWLADHPDGVRIVGFDEHNGASAKKRATTAKRVASHRGNADVKPEQASGNAAVTQPALQDEHASVTTALAREDIEKRREEETREESPPAARVPPTASPPVEPQLPQKSANQPKGSRLPADWTLSEDLAEWAMREVGMTAEAVRKEAAKFRDYWVAKTGREATKADWPATWRNWCRNAWPPRNGPGGQGGIGGPRQGAPHDPAGRNAEAKRLLFGWQETAKNQPEDIDA